MHDTTNTNQTVFKTGDEAFTLNEKAVATLSDFWRWAYSDLTEPAERMKLAEYLVRLGLGCTNAKCTSGFHDIFWEEQDIKIAVATIPLGSLKERGQTRLSLSTDDEGVLQIWDDSVFAGYKKTVSDNVDVHVGFYFDPPHFSGYEPYLFDLTKWSFWVTSQSMLYGKTIQHYHQDNVTLDGLTDAVKEAAQAKKSKVDNTEKIFFDEAMRIRGYVNTLVVQFEGRDVFVPIPEWSGDPDEIRRTELVLLVNGCDTPLAYELDTGTLFARRI